jgi:protocatechuate 3,4-dioxygenase beta subunit
MLPLLFLALLADAPEKCTVSGTVVDSVTGKGVAKAAVYLHPVDTAKSHTAMTITGGDGKFTMVELEPGEYRLRTRRSGYLEAGYGARSQGWRGAVLSLEAGQKLEIEHKLVPAGVVRGVVRDRDGEPVEHAHIVAARRTAEYGRPRLEGVESADTDDRGEYRVGGLAPGRYVILAELRQQEWDTVDHSPAGSRPAELDVPTWYPGSPDSSGAAALMVRAGAGLEGIDITLLRRRGYRVSGRLVNRPAGVRPAIALLPAAEDDAGDFVPHTTVRNSAGEFEFRNVPPGSYLLKAGFVSMPLTVGSADVEGVRVEFGPPAEVKGKITIEGEAAGARVSEVFLTYDGRRGASLAVRPDLTFQANFVEPRKYEVRVEHGEPWRLYVKSMRSGERDVLADGLTVAGGSTPLDIVLAADGARVDGVVTNVEGKALLGATVVLAPVEGLRGRWDLYRSATTDPFGKFAFDPAAPGEYRLFAWEDVEEGAWHDQEFLREYEGGAEKVVVKAGERKSLAVKAR